MDYKTWGWSTKLSFLIILVLLCSTLTESKGGSSGGVGGGGGRGGGGGGGRGPGGRSLGKSSSGKSNLGKKVVVGGLVAVGGAAAYKAYKTNHNKGKTSELSRQVREDSSSGRVGPPYFHTQPSTSYGREGVGMSAWTLLAIILGILGFGAGIWCCVTICVPLYHDKQSRRNRNMSFSHTTKGSDDMPLQETPPTATPSP